MVCWEKKVIIRRKRWVNTEVILPTERFLREGFHYSQQLWYYISRQNFSVYAVCSTDKVRAGGGIPSVCSFKNTVKNVECWLICQGGFCDLPDAESSRINCLFIKSSSGGVEILVYSFPQPLSILTSILFYAWFLFKWGVASVIVVADLQVSRPKWR